MKSRKTLAYLTLLALLLSLVSCGQSFTTRKLEEPGQAPASQDNTETRITEPYIFEVGDEVTVKVWGFDDLVRTSIIINNSGDVYFPMLGPVKFAGLSVPKVREQMTAGLKKYIVDPQVEITTTATTVRQRIYVLGEVANAGALTYARPMTVMEAIAKAGWFSLTGNKKRVILIRRANNQYNVFAIDTAAFFQDGAKAPAIYLQSGDLLIVPPSTITNVERFLTHFQNILQPFMNMEQMIVLWPQFINALEGKTSGTGLAISTSGGTSTSTTTTTSTSTSSTATSSSPGTTK